MEKLSVIICTYNPDPGILSKCLSHILTASQKLKPYEIILVDNNSNNRFDSAQHLRELIEQLNIKLIKEPKQGLTNARLKGISEATGQILVFIDDDNLIAPDFFEQGVLIADKHPNIGSWSGQVLLEFEKEPERWTRKYWGLLVHRELVSDLWSNLPLLPDTMPCGAGLFVRREVADFYRKLHLEGKRNIQLDRNGGSLFSGGDNDLAACACDLGLGVGLFHRIILNHYIPLSRLRKQYLLNLAKGIAASSIVLSNYRGVITSAPSARTRIANILRIVLKKPVDRAFYKAVLKGQKEGMSLIRQNEKAD